MSNLTHRLYTGEISYGFIARRKTWYILSAIVIAVSIFGLVARGLTLGIEFRGGADFQAVTKVTAKTVGEFGDAVVETGLPDMDSVTVTTIGSDRVRVQTRPLNGTDEISAVRDALAAKAGIKSEEVAYDLIGASWGEQITNKALIALAIFLALVMLMIWVYFRDWKMSITAIVALAHDILVTVGVYALVGFTVTPATLIGVLTILGYSLYDTVVVFDKVRENVHNITDQDRTYPEAANAAINQVLVRSLNTTIIGVLPVAAILFAGTFVLGTGPLKDLGLALFVGMIAGAYSSIFIATPLLSDLKRVEPEMRKHTARVQKRRERHAMRVESTEEPTKKTEPAAVVAVPVGERVQPKRQSRAQRKKDKHERSETD